LRIPKTVLEIGFVFSTSAKGQESVTAAAAAAAAAAGAAAES
jgi:hypothetical protein